MIVFNSPTFCLLCVKRAPRSYKMQRAHSDAFHRTQKIKFTTQDYNNRWDFYSAFKGTLYIKYLHTTVSTAKPEFLIPGHFVYPSSLTPFTPRLFPF